MKGEKTGGREKGTPNRLTKELRSALKDLLHGEIQALPQRLDKLEDKERIYAVIKLLSYAVPKPNAVNAYDGEPLQWETY
jgi:hypothetical protein